MASTSGEFVAHVSSASATSESVFITEKLLNKESIFAGSQSEHPKPLIFLHSVYSLLVENMCAFYFHEIS